MSSSRTYPHSFATGVGSLPGTDPIAACQVVRDELTYLPHLPELPTRGPWANIIGRGCALLVDMPTELEVGRWRMSSRPGKDAAKARSFIAEDLDVFSEQMEGSSGSVKVQVCGPVTLAATLELASGQRAISDSGAFRDLTASLVQGIGEHLADLRRRLPDVEFWWLQLDEPSLPNSLAGALPRASGYGQLSALSDIDAATALRAATAMASANDAFSVVHSCANDLPMNLLTGVGATAISLDVADLLQAPDRLDATARWLDSGGIIFAGVPAIDAAAEARVCGQLGHSCGIGGERLANQLVVTPKCGLPDVSFDDVRSTYRCTRDVAIRLYEDPEGDR